MMRVRLKADGRIVEIMPDGQEKTVDHKDPAAFVRHVRARCGLTQARLFANRPSRLHIKGSRGNVALPLSLIPMGDGRLRPALGRS